MRWHRNPFFHTAVLPPSVAPSAVASARPSTDIEGAAAAAHARAAAVAAANAADPGPYADPPVSDDGAKPAPTAPRQPEQAHGLLAEAASRLSAQFHGQRLSFMGRRREPKLPRLTILEASDHLTPYQAFYIFGIDGLGAFVLSGGINFAIAYAMYKTIDAVKHPIRLFRFPNTLAGDAAVTVFLQCVITWFIELVLVNRDLRSGHIQPIGFIPEPSNGLLRWLLLLDRLPSAATRGGQDGSDSGNTTDMQRPLSAPHDENCRCEAHIEPYEPGSWTHWLYFLISQLIRALLMGVVAFLLTWGPAIGIMTAIGNYHDGDWWFSGASWAPPLFKLIYGGVLSLLTTPPSAAFWLVRCGWALQANQRHLGEA